MVVEIYEVKRMDLDLFSIGGIAALIASAIALYRAWRFREAEADKTDAEVSDKFQELATKSAQHASSLLDRVIILEKEIGSLKEDVEAQQDFISTLKEGIRGLLKQIVEAGLDPVWTPPEWTRPRRENQRKGGDR